MGTEPEDADIGPVDFLLVEFPGSKFRGEIIPEILKLVESGTIRVLELMVITKAEDGSIVALDANDIDDSELISLAPVASGTLGVLGDEDIANAGSALEPGSTAGLLIWENLWAIPFVNAVRRADGHVVSTGRIPAEDLIEALEAAEASES